MAKGQSRIHMTRLATNLLVACGIVLAVFGVAIDYILPGTSPGLNLPQLVIIAAGLTIVFGALRYRRSRSRQGAAKPFGRTILKAMIITVVTLLALEILLTVWGMPTYFPSELPDLKVEQVPWYVCDELGCHYRYDEVLTACASGQVSGRHCVVNRQGFPDVDDFIAREDFAERFRILMLGDSFTHGFSADVGKSFVETLESALPDAVIWNTAIISRGTSHAIATFDAFAPLLRPQLSILGFYMNDFRDNLLPLNDWLYLRNAEGELRIVRRYLLDRWGKPVDLPPEFRYTYLAAGYFPPVNEMERIVGQTRLGTLAIRLLDNIGDLVTNDSQDHQVKLTRQYLIQLRDAAHELDSDFLVLIIPQPEDVGNPGDLYQLAVRLMQELAIPFMEVIDLLDSVADYAEPPDNHWNNAGHQKVGALLTECVNEFIASGDLANCERVVMS